MGVIESVRSVFVTSGEHIFTPFQWYRDALSLGAWSSSSLSNESHFTGIITVFRDICRVKLSQSKETRLRADFNKDLQERIIFPLLDTVSQCGSKVDAISHCIFISSLGNTCLNWKALRLIDWDFYLRDVGKKKKKVSYSLYCLRLFHMNQGINYVVSSLCQLGLLMVNRNRVIRTKI